MKHFLHFSFIAAFLSVLPGIISAQNTRLFETKTEADSIRYWYAYNFYKKGSDTLQMFNLLKQKAEKGNPQAQYYVAGSYLRGIGVTKNMTDYFKWINKSADNNNCDAINELAHIYRYGTLAPRNKDKAIKLLEKGDSLNNIRSKLFLGEIYLNGEGRKADFKKAFRLFTESAQLGNAQAAFQVGNMYKHGLGVKKDNNEAINWFTKSATQGNDQGMYALGYMYFKGMGVAQDYTKAKEWLQKSAALLNRNGAFMLGLCYKDGYGTTHDSAMAAKWLTRADLRKNFQAKSAFDDLTKPKNRKKSVSEIDAFIPRTYSRVKSAAEKLSVAGVWEGKLVIYDWSGNQIIEEQPVKAAFIENGEKVTGYWAINDSITVFGNGTTNGSSIDFTHMTYAKPEWYCNKPIKWEISQGSFKRSDMDSSVIIGNLSLYSTILQEEGNPNCLVLKKTKSQPNSYFAGLTSTNKFTASVYPNPFTDWININYQLPSAGTVKIELLETSGKRLTVIAEKNLEAGAYTETFICPDKAYSSKLYLLSIKFNKEVIMLKVVKR